jgi:hypothetical protein
MVGKLRISFLLMFLLFAKLTWADNVVFDFSKDKSYEMFGLKGISSGDSHDGDITVAKTAQVGEVAVTVEPNSNENYPNRMWKGSLRLYGGKLIVKAPKAIKEINMVLNYDNWGNNTANVGELTKGHWVGDAQTVEISIGKNTQIKSFTVKYGEETVTPGDKVYTIHDLCQMTTDLTDIEIKLTDAKVLYCFYTSAWVRQGNDAIMLYLTGIDYQTNDILNGTFRADFMDYYGTPEIKGNFMTTNAENLQITNSEEEPTPVKATFEDIEAKKYLSDLVEIEDVEVIVEEDMGTNFFMVKDGKRIQLYNKLQLDMEAVEDGKYTVRGIVTLHNNKAQLYPTELILVSSGIGNIRMAKKQTPMYNMGGQRVGVNYKGVVIQNGKKIIRR